jgi:outer membrane protein
VKHLPIALFFAATTACAQAPLTWQDALREAAVANPDLAASAEAVRAAVANLEATRSERRPQLSGSAELGASGGDLIEDEPLRSADAAVRASQLLYAGGRTEAAIEQREATLDETAALYRQTAATVGFDLKAAFARLLYAQELVGLTSNILKRREDNLDLVELRYEGGRENKGSFLRSKASTAQARFDVEQARRSVHVAQRTLARALGRVDAQGLAVAGSLEPERPEASPDFHALAVVSPLRDQAEAQRRFAEAGVRSAKSAYYPELSLVGSYGRSGEDLPDEDRWTVGLALDVPLYPGGRTRHEVEAARAALRQAEQRMRSREGDVLGDLVSAHASLLDGIDQVDVRIEFRDAAQVRAEIGRSQYASGLMTFEDWDVIENDLINAEQALLASRRDAVLAEAAWDLAKGKVLFP